MYIDLEVVRSTVQVIDLLCFFINIVPLVLEYLYFITFIYALSLFGFCCDNSGRREVAMEWGGGVAKGHLGWALHHLVHGLGTTTAGCVLGHSYDHSTRDTGLCPTQCEFMQ